MVETSRLQELEAAVYIASTQEAGVRVLSSPFRFHSSGTPAQRMMLSTVSMNLLRSLYLFFPQGHVQMFVPWGILSLVTLTILIITTTNVEPKHAISNYNNSDHQISGFLNGRTFCLLPVSREALWEACDIALASPKTLWRNKSKCQGLFHLALSFSSPSRGNF